MDEPDSWAAQINSIGAFIRRQRHLANLSLRELAELTSVSNAYLSQIERGLHEPSVRVLTSVARALNLSAETLLAQAGVLEASARHTDAAHGDDHRTSANAGTTAGTEAAILADERLSDQHKQALLAVYRSFLAEPATANTAPTTNASPTTNAAPPAGNRVDKQPASRARRPARKEPT